MIKRSAVKKPRYKLPKFVATKYPPLTSEPELKRTIKEQNALNRARSKKMENRVAAVLKGRRVLLSGAAAQYKGDVEVRFENYPGGYIIECKLSAQTKGNDKEPHIRLQFSWFPKMHEEAVSMNMKFCILIVNFLGSTRDYVFIRKDIVAMLIKRYKTPYAATVSTLATEAKLLDLTKTKGGKPRVGHTLERRELEDNMITVNNMQGVRVIVPDGEYLVMHIDNFATITSHM